MTIDLRIRAVLAGNPATRPIRTRRLSSTGPAVLPAMVPTIPATARLFLYQDHGAFR